MGWQRDYEPFTEQDLKDQVETFKSALDEPDDLSGKEFINSEEIEEYEKSIHEKAEGLDGEFGDKKEKPKQKKRPNRRMATQKHQLKKGKSISKRVMKLKQKSQIQSGITRRIVRTAPSQ
jgi:hypothetical protein